MSESVTDRDFSDINNNRNYRKKPTSNYKQNKQLTATTPSQSVYLNREYLVSLNGILRILIIVSHTLRPIPFFSKEKAFLYQLIINDPFF